MIMSSCSSTDLGIDTDFDDILTESLVNDIELFVEHVHRLRNALDTNVFDLDCETKCVQVHAALSMVSQSVRDLLVKYPNFKTSNVLIPASQLVHSVKAIKFDSAKFDSGRSLQAIERLEAAIGNALRHSVNNKFFAGELSTTNLTNSHSSTTSTSVSSAALPATKPSSLIDLKKKNVIVNAPPNEFSFDNSADKCNFSTDVLISTVDMTHLNDKQDSTHGLTKTTIKLPALNKNSINVLSGCEGKKLTTVKSIKHLLNEDLLSTNKNNNDSSSQTIIHRKSSSSVTSSLDDTSANSSHISSNGSVKSNEIEARSLSVGHRTFSYVTNNNNNNNNAPLRNIMNTTPLTTKQPHGKNSGKNNSGLLVRRHSTYQDSGNKINKELSDPILNSSNKRNDLITPVNSNSSSAQLMFNILTAHENGIELAFNRCKSWSKYASHLLMFARSRMQFELDHVRNLQKLAEQSKAVLLVDSTNNYLPLIGIFDELMDTNLQIAHRTTRTITNLNQRFITTLENRQKEHDIKRRKLKLDWTKQKKQFDACAEELRRAHLTLNSKEGGYLKARDLALRHEQQCTSSAVVQQQSGLLSLTLSSASSSDPQQKKLKELEKKRKNEEDALNRKTDAENEVWRLERELEVRRIELNDLRNEIIGELCDLIRHCDLTTIACASHYFKAFSELWAPVPEEYNRLAAYAIRESSPSSDYMSFLNSQLLLTAPKNANNITASNAHFVSEQSFNKNDNALNAPLETVLHSTSAPTSANITPSFSHAGKGPFQNRPQFVQQHSIAVMNSDSYYNSPSTSSATASSNSSLGPRRRNALNADEHYELIAETTQRRQKKSVARLFEQISSNSSIDISDAARSHQLQRTRQVTKCAHCEHLVIFDALKCSTCGIVWHKKCLASVRVICGPSARRITEESSAQRRMSIFGIPLKGHLDAQQRRIPLILEKCVEELHKRGMTCKGLYRICGVKSKIEQICVSFEQTATTECLNLSNVHPMNLASVIKLYLRRLPEPLMTYELYNDWLQFNGDLSNANANAYLRELVSKLPQQNYDTLKFLILHLKRVTWFESDNLMTASNLAAVISPSLIWARIADIRQTSGISRNKLNSVSSSNALLDCTSFINDAHQQTKAVELMVQNAFDVFSVDRTTDWDEFFNMYPDVAKPRIVDENNDVDVSNRNETFEMCSQLNEDEDDVDDDSVDEDEDYDICSCNVSTKTPQQISSNDLTLTSQNINGSNIDCKNVYRNERLSHYYRSPSAPAPISNNSYYLKNSLQTIHNTNVSNACKHNQKNSIDEIQSFSNRASSSSTFVSVSNSTESQKLKNNLSNFSGSSLPPTGFSSTNSINNFIASSDNLHTSNVKSSFTEQNTALESTKPNLKTGISPSPTTIVLKPRRTGSGLGNKQRSFTTSILVSPRSDKKFAAMIAARQNKQLSNEENIKTTSPTFYSNHKNDLSFIKLSLNTKKFRETSRSYQRLTQDEDFLTENKNDEKLNCNKNQEKNFSSSKDQHYMPSHNSAKCVNQNGFKPNTECSKNLSNYELNESKHIDSFADTAKFSSQSTQASDSGSLSSTIQSKNLNSLLRRKRLERTAAHHKVSALADSQPIITKYCNQQSTENKLTLTQTNQSNKIKSHQILNKAPALATNDNISNAEQQIELSNNNSNISTTIDNSLDMRLQNAVSVIFSGKDVSYV